MQFGNYLGQKKDVINPILNEDQVLRYVAFLAVYLGSVLVIKKQLAGVGIVSETILTLFLGSSLAEIL